MSRSPNYYATGPLSFKIEIEGDSLSDTFQVMEITCSSGLGQNSTAQIQLAIDKIELWPQNTNPFEIFALNKNVKISAGYDGKNAKIFFGEVIEQAFKTIVGGNIGGMVIIKCRSNEVIDKNITPDPEPVLSLKYGDDIISIEASSKSKGLPFYGSGRVTFSGNSLVAPGKTISINGFYPKLGGMAMTTSIIHKLEEGNWFTTLDYELFYN